MFPTFSVGEGLLSNEEFILKLNDLVDYFPVVKTNKGTGYYNIPAGFDIEVSSFYIGDRIPENKRSCMYLWQFGIFNLVTCGREWSGYEKLVSIVKKVMRLSNELRLVVYVHNLPYEFQFIRKHFEWQEVFILSERKPVYANNFGIEYRCSLKLSGGRSLDKISSELMKYKIRKAVGNLDYNLVRHSKTPLSSSELYYGECDIRVILCYVQEKIETDGDITKIPLTNTGYVRSFVRGICFKRYEKYRRLITSLVLSPDEYRQAKRAFAGGFTHANYMYIRKIVANVFSKDFTSSYPGVMVLEKFPMSSAKTVEVELTESALKHYLTHYCCMFDIEIWDLVPKITVDNPISRSKCTEAVGCTINNGRVSSAAYIKTTITEQDYFIYTKFYSWEKIEISNFRYYEKAYLPKEIVDSVLTLFADKNLLADVEGMEVDYMIKKNMLNACYGMVVTDIVRDNLKYQNGHYFKEPASIVDCIEKYNKGKRRFLFYLWGLWVTAYARANLYSGIVELQDDYIYSDTDSLKYINEESHREYFQRYNQQILEKIHKSAEHFNFDESRYMPITMKGKQKVIGTWSDDGHYDEFKTLGAKRYLVRIGDKYKLTVAGVNKEGARDYLVSTGNPFENFDDNLEVPPEYAKRLILTYNDDETEGDIVDYTGQPGHYHELSSIHMEPSKYSLSMSEEFKQFLLEYTDFSED